MPPSPGGTRRCRYTSKPARVSRDAASLDRIAFRKQPPVNTTRDSPVVSRKRRHTATITSVSVVWNRRAMTAGATPARRSPATPRTSGRVSTTSGALVSSIAKGYEALDHDRERFVVTPLAPPQLANRVAVGRIAGQMKAAQPFHGDDVARRERASRCGHRIARDETAAAIHRRHSRTTRRARDRVRMESPIARILVLAPARLAHLEQRHRRPLAIVGSAGDDRQPRAARGAVDERIAVPVRGIEQLGETRVARCDGGADEDVGSFADAAWIDPEADVASRQQRPRRDRIDARERRRTGGQRAFEPLERVAIGFDFGDDTRGTGHETAEVEAGGEPVDERAKTDALNDPVDGNGASLHKRFNTAPPSHAPDHRHEASRRRERPCHLLARPESPRPGP